MGKHSSDSSKTASSAKKENKSKDSKSKDVKTKDSKSKTTKSKTTKYENTPEDDEPKNKRTNKKDKNHDIAKDRRSKIDKIARLHVPANKIKKNMLAYWKIENEDPPSLRDQVHIAVASIIEDITIMTLEKAMPQSNKNSFGRCIVGDNNIRTAIDEDPTLRKLFKITLQNYNEDINYVENSILNGDELNYTLSTLDDVYQFSGRALNMMCYIINTFFNDHIMAGLRAIKKHMEPKGMSIKNRMLNTILEMNLCRTILRPMRKKAMECVRKVEEYNHQNREEAEQKRADSEEVADNSDDEDTKKSSKKSKGSKKEESDDESDDEDDKKKSSKNKKSKNVKKKEDSDDEDKKKSSKKSKGAKKHVDESDDDDEDAEESDEENAKPSKNSKKGKHSSSNN